MLYYIILLLYADDLVIVGDHIWCVQRILNALSGFCVKWGLKVNMSKTYGVMGEKMRIYITVV